MTLTIIKHGVPIKVEITQPEYDEILSIWISTNINTITQIVAKIPSTWPPDLSLAIVDKAIKPFHYFLQEELERRYDIDKKLL